MILSDNDIARELAYGDLFIDPVDLDKQLQPCSLDIRLGNEIGQYACSDNVVFDAKYSRIDDYIETELIPEEEGVLIQPDEFYLANTMETITIPDYLEADLMGRSSLARMGVEVHQTAGLFDAGFSGQGVLEISSAVKNPVRLYPGMRVAQLVFKELKNPAKNAYNSEDNKYQNQKGAVGSRIHEDGT